MMKKMDDWFDKNMFLVWFMVVSLCIGYWMFVCNEELKQQKVDMNQAIAEFYAEHEYGYENMTVEVIEVDETIREHYGNEGTITCLIYENGELKKISTINKEWAHNMMLRENS